MDRMDAISPFVRLVDSSSFSAVTHTFGVAQPALNKQIAALEVYLGAQLLQHTSRSLTLTEAGRDFYESGMRLLGELEPPGGRHDWIG